MNVKFAGEKIRQLVQYSPWIWQRKVRMWNLHGKALKFLVELARVKSVTLS